MSAESTSDLPAEIGHVLCVDIVGYSKLLIDEQSELLRHLKEMVRGSEQVRRADAEGKLIRLPTGDGMALVFRNNPESPARCALELSRADKEHPELRLRMGIHSGPINEVTDVNERANVTGGGINIAQRVMDCGDAGHILLSKRAAEDLAQYRHWQALLHDLGECEVKHGVRLALVNLYTDTDGNPELPDKLKRTHEQHAAQDHNVSSRRRRLRAAAFYAAASVLAVVALLAYQFVSHRDLRDTALEKAIAVLPLVNDTGDPNNEYFSDGLSEELISALTQIKALKVIGRTSSFHFKNTNEESKVIGAALGVGYLLEGSVRKSAGRARIAVNLVRAADGVSAWSQIFDRALPDIFAVQAEIAQSVAGALKVALLGDAEKNPDAPSNQNVDAYTAYLQGRYYESRYTAADLRKAIGFYDAAIQSDPHYALAYSALSKSWWALGDITGKDVAEANRKARAAAERAVSEDPNLGEGHSALGQILVSGDRNAKGAEAEYRRAAALAPASVEPKIGLSTILANLGQIEEAVELLQQAVRLDPLSTNSHFDLARLLTSLGRYDEAAESARKAIALQPGGAGTWQMLALVEAKRGDGEAALKAATQEADPDWRAYAMALAQQARGDRAAADAALDALIAGHSDDMSFQIATVYAFRGDADKTFEWLDRAYEKRDPGVMAINDNPFTRELRSDPRFVAFRKKVGLPLAP